MYILMGLMSLLLIACTPSNTLADNTGDILNNTQWTLVNLANQAVVADTLITLNFDGSRITGTDSCNRYNTSYTLNKRHLTINKSPVTTLMACPEPIMRQASNYIDALRQTVSYQTEGQQLILLDENNKPLATFNKQSTTLSGTTWQAISVNNGKQAVVSLIKDSAMTASFGANGALTGSAGCNNYMTHYEVAGQNVTIKPARSTRKMCGDTGVMAQETQFLHALTTVANYQLEGKRLQLRTASGALAVMLVSP